MPDRLTAQGWLKARQMQIRRDVSEVLIPFGFLPSGIDANQQAPP
jgi:hypothetical protein